MHANVIHPSAILGEGKAILHGIAQDVGLARGKRVPDHCHHGGVIRDRTFVEVNVTVDIIRVDNRL